MRMFFGIIIGIVLTIAAAYVSDMVRNTSGGEGTFDRPVVNWDVVNHGIKALPSTVKGGWARLTGHPKDN
jgi:hypothetical protein